MTVQKTAPLNFCTPASGLQGTKVVKRTVLCQNKTDGYSFFVTFVPSLCPLWLKIRQNKIDKTLYIII